mmetsp:Transcript_23848/g.66155  ORF Transcript_23848/g.66155 Transcript_23848/m.66155 type:complete len:263 (-) Transcript_23848:69-857(-)
MTWIRKEEARQRLTAAARKDSDCMPVIHSLEGRVSSLAMELQRAQDARVSGYDICEPLEGAPCYFMVVRSRKLTGTWLDESNHHDTNFGFQIHEFSKRRITAARSCSCQFNTCWGLPCRHMLRVCLELKIRVEFPEGVVKPFWNNLDRSTLAAKRRELLLHPVPVSNSSTTTRELEPTKRFKLLAMESKKLIDLGSSSKEVMEVVLRMFDSAVAEVEALVGKHESNLSKALRGHAIVVRNPVTSLRNAGRPNKKRKESAGKL